MPNISTPHVSPDAPAMPAPGELLVLESCHSTWAFDFDRMRFRRVLKQEHAAATAWEPFYGLELEEGRESFVVLLNRSGTRLMRSWRHLSHCTQCGGEVTTELSLQELRSTVAARPPAANGDEGRPTPELLRPRAPRLRRAKRVAGRWIPRPKAGE